MDSASLRKIYLEFFKSKGHAVIPGASLIPEHDPTVLFTTAGMHPLVPFLLGEKHPAGRRLVDVQKCIRTGDIEKTGDSWHLTFFEMLGNWSLGDYFKKEAIEWSWEFLTDKKWLGLDPQRLYITIFMGNENSPMDEESAGHWKIQFEKVGIKAEICPYNQPTGDNFNFRIFPLPAEDNWWGPAGLTGPCGPCTEMFYDTGKSKCSDNCRPGCACGKYVEIWNDVFMEYNKKVKSQNSKVKSDKEIEYEYVPLSQKNVDTGMGIERTIAVLNGLDNVYETELFRPLIKKIEEISGKKYDGENLRPFRIISDHIKAATFILAEGLEPSKEERGYVVRRLIRRAVRYGKQLGIKDNFTFKVAEAVLGIYKDVYPELSERKDFIKGQLVKEEEKFGKTLEKGLREFRNQISKIKSQNDKSKSKIISGKFSFDLYQTFGFPIELIEELAEEEGMSVDRKNFDDEFIKHQEISRTGSEQKFKGGLADHSEQVVKYHTAAHLMLAALRQVLGPEVFQKGSNITAERLRFDFSHPQKMTEAEIKEVENIVNKKIEENLPVKMEEMTLEEAKKEGAMGVFEARYGERVKVYSIGDPAKGGQVFSKEICGGPHVQNTGILGKFKIVKEEASSAGVRRIKAILE